MILKKALAVLSALTLALSLSACGSTTSSSLPASSAPSSSSIPVSSAPSSSLPESSSAAESTSAPSAATADLGDTLEESIKISLDGVVYSFPGSTFADFAANGWAIDPGYDSATLPANTTTRVEYTKGDSSIEMSALNETTAVAPITEATCWSLVLDSYKMKDLEMSLPGGISLESSPEDVEAAYEGISFEPYDNAEGERLSMEYKLNDCKIKFSFFEGSLSGLDIRC